MKDYRGPYTGAWEELLGFLILYIPPLPSSQPKEHGSFAKLGSLGKNHSTNS